MLNVLPQCLAMDKKVVHVYNDENVDVLDQQPVDTLLESSRSIRYSEG